MGMDRSGDDERKNHKRLQKIYLHEMDKKYRNNFMLWKLTDKEFEKLWKLNIWEKLGEVCNLNVGRFNDVGVLPGKIFTGQEIF